MSQPTPEPMPTTAAPVGDDPILVARDLHRSYQSGTRRVDAVAGAAGAGALATLGLARRPAADLVRYE
jgi:hypothetical protein